MRNHYTLRIDNSNGEQHIAGQASTQAGAVELLGSHIRRWRRAGASVSIPKGWLGLWTATCIMDGVLYQATVCEPEPARVPLLGRLAAV